MKIISLDPSSTCTGFAVFVDDYRLVSCGKLLPCAKNKDDAFERIFDLCAQVKGLCITHAPGVAVIEWTSGKVGLRHKGRGAGLAIYGAAVGAIAGAVHAYNCEFAPVKENDWIKGRSKRTRQIEALQFKEYNPKEDRGYDVSDAIALGLWWYRHNTEVAKL